MFPWANPLQSLLLLPSSRSLPNCLQPYSSAPPHPKMQRWSHVLRGLWCLVSFIKQNVCAVRVAAYPFLCSSLLLHSIPSRTGYIICGPGQSANGRSLIPKAGKRAITVFESVRLSPLFCSLFLSLLWWFLFAIECWYCVPSGIGILCPCAHGPRAAGLPAASPGLTCCGLAGGVS